MAARQTCPSARSVKGTCRPTTGGTSMARRCEPRSAASCASSFPRASEAAGRCRAASCAACAKESVASGLTILASEERSGPSCGTEGSRNNRVDVLAEGAHQTWLIFQHSESGLARREHHGGRMPVIRSSRSHCWTHVLARVAASMSSGSHSGSGRKICEEETAASLLLSKACFLAVFS